MADYERFFVIDRLLGQGAFGEVYKVYSRRDRMRRYALKVIDLDNYQLTLDDVLKEFNVMKNMEHRNILTMVGAFHCMDYSGRRVRSFAIQMEYCPFGDLSNFLRNRDGKLLRRWKLLQWMEDLTSAVEYIHNKDVIHRDLKPDNILLDRYSILRISDFGIAKIMTQYYATTAVGTPHFVAPEVFQRGRHTKKADIFSLGQVFICMATLDCIPACPGSIPDRYDDWFMDVMANCIDYNPKYRPTASTLLELLMEMK